MQKRTKQRVISGVLALVVAGSAGMWFAHKAEQEAKAEHTQNATMTRVKNTKTLQWGVKGDTRLMGLMDIKKGELDGFEIDLAKAITKKIDPEITPEFTQITSGTRIPMLLNGNIDTVVATMSITPERAEVVDFSTPYFNAGQSLMVPNNSAVQTVKDLNRPDAKVIGVTGSSSVANFKKVAPKAKVIALPDYATALTALKSGQGDALTTDSGILYGMAVGTKDFRVTGGNFVTDQYGMAIAPDNPEMVQAINDGFAAVKKDGTYAKLAEKWFGKVPGMNWKEIMV